MTLKTTSLSPLQIFPGVLNQIKSFVEDSVEEHCGFLFGVDYARYRGITHVMSVKNVALTNKTRTYAIASKDYIKAEAFALEHNIQLLGVFHSHPNCPPIPSAYDQTAAHPFFSYMILSVMAGKVDRIRSWRLNDHNVFAEEFFLTENINYPLHGYRNYSDSAA